MNYQAFFRDKLDELKENGQYRYFLEVNKSAQHFPHFYFTDHNDIKRSAINWCSNDYLGMSTHESVIAKLSMVLHRSGAGSGGTRNISGTTIHHKELENTIAKWHQLPAAIVFGGAYLANLTALQTLGKQIPDLIFISDEKNHASIIEGIHASGKEKIIFRHNDTHHLEEILSSLPADRPKLVVFESVYSMSGTVAPVKEIIRLAKRYNALTYVDEVHAAGLYGPTGAGLLEQEGLLQDIDIINGTLSKAVGVFGGYITSSSAIIDFIRSFGSGFIFTTSLPPAVCAAAAKGIELIQTDAALRKGFHDNVKMLRTFFTERNIPFAENDSHITPVHIGDAVLCKKIADRLLLEFGVYLQPVNYPTVKKGEACLRVIVTARHTEADILELSESLALVLKEAGLIISTQKNTYSEA